MTTKAVTVMGIWLAPKPSPKAIAKNRNASSSGSLIAARNRTIDKAPTSPKDNASEDLTTLIISVVVAVIITKLLANFLRLEIEVP